MHGQAVKETVVSECEWKDLRAFVAYRVATVPRMRLVPATSSRQWMDTTSERFAHRCLPLLIANQNGWVILNSHRFRATWNGEPSPKSLEVECLTGTAPYPATSHFGHGILTWTLPYLFRTPPGYNLLVRGPANSPKDGVCPLEGIVETDWAVATFTMNWQLTRPGLAVTFDVDEPICMLVPQQRGELEAMRPEIHEIASERELQETYERWLQSRTQFLMELKVPQMAGPKNAWQRHYFHGTSPGGQRADQHQTKLTLRPFYDHTSGQAMASAVAQSNTARAACIFSTRRPDAARARSSLMSHQAFGPGDLDRINRVLLHYPEVADVIRILQVVSAKTTYPIQSFDHLIEACGGDDATITVQGREVRLAELQPAIPAYYFPIGSEDDLIAKIADVRVKGQTVIPPPISEHGVQWGPEVDAPPPGTDPPDERVRDLPRRPGVPAASGLKREV